MSWRTPYCNPFVFISLVLLSLALPNSFVKAQDPTFYKIGERELETEDVYSMTVTSDNVLYVGVENGMMKYENETFKYLSFPKEINNHSLFHVTKNSKDEVFSIDLKGRIFQAVGDSLKLIFSLENEYVHTLPQLICGNDDNLYLGAQNIYKISKTGKLLDVIETYSLIHVLSDNSFFYFDESGLVHVSKNGTHRYKTIIHDRKIPKYYRTVYFAKHWLMEEDRSHLDELPNLDSYQIETSIRNYEHCFHLDTNRFFILNHIQGVSELKWHGNQAKLENRFFEDHFISSFCSAKNGTLYFGTFKQGIIIVPNYQVRSKKTDIKPKSILDFELNSKNEIYVSLRNRGIFKIIDNHPKLIEDVQRFTFSKMIYADSLEYSDQKHGFDKLFYKTNYTGALKDIEIIDKDNGLMLCNSGLYLISEKDTFLGLDYEVKKSVLKYTKLLGRNLAVEFDKKRQKLYIANQYDLYLVERGKEQQGIKFDNERITAAELVFDKNTLWISDFKKGILSLTDGKVRKEFSTANGLYSNIVTQMIKHDSKLYIIASGKLQIIDLDTRKIIPISKQHGIIGKVNKIIVNDNILWLLIDNTDILSIPVEDLPSKVSEFDLKIKSLLNNEREIPIVENEKFSKSDNKFLFNFKLSHFTNNEETKLCYRLMGLDNEYKCIPFPKDGIEYKSLPPGKYTFSAFSKYGSNSSNAIKYRFEVQQSFWLTNTFIISMLLLALALIYLFLRIRMRIQDRRADQKYREHQINSELMESKLVALRSQMNPHFIFNSLNAIQDLILKKNTLLAYDYVVLFSQLTRSTLNFSTKEFIPIEKEIEFLKIYLKLEKLRFNEDFSYTIESDDLQDVWVPTLIIQPFIENALKHGLRHKLGKKQLDVSFKRDREVLKCTIIDNGIGQEAALQIKARQSKKQISFALKSIKDRLRILSKKHGQIYSYEIFDLKQNGISNGTKVILQIPYKPNIESV